MNKQQIYQQSQVIYRGEGCPWCNKWPKQNWGFSKEEFSKLWVEHKKHYDTPYKPKISSTE